MESSRSGPARPEVEAYCAFIAKMLARHVEASRGCFALNAFSCRAPFWGKGLKISAAWSCVWLEDEPSQRQPYCPRGPPEPERTKGSDIYARMAAVLLACGCRGSQDPGERKQRSVPSILSFLTRRSLSISKKATLKSELVRVETEWVITVMVGSNVSLKMKGRDT